MALPPLPKTLFTVGSRDHQELARRLDEWARGIQAAVGSLRTGVDANTRSIRSGNFGGGGGSGGGVDTTPDGALLSDADGEVLLSDADGEILLADV